MDPAALNKFLDLMHWVSPNLNDCFGYACADAEKLYMDGEGENNQEAFVRAYTEHGFPGILAYVSKVRNAVPIRELRTPEFEAALRVLDGWEYDPD